jgi:protein required for attachment to host cells
MSISKTVWYVIADGARARVVERNRESGAYHPIRLFRSKLARLKSSKLKSDRPGRVIESSTSARHAASPRHDPHADAKLAFARDVAGHIESAAKGREFDELVLAAPSRILNEIKKHLETRTLSQVVSELAKDLTKTPDGKLGDHLDEIALRIERGFITVDRHLH